MTALVHGWLGDWWWAFFAWLGIVYFAKLALLTLKHTAREFRHGDK